MKHWKTTVFGAVAGLAGLLHAQGVTIGHIGGSDFVSLVGSLGQILFGYYAADAVRSSAGNFGR